MVCLESDFLVELSRCRPEAILKMRKLVEARKPLFVTPVSATEIFMGAFKSNDPQEFLKTEELLSTLKLLEYDFHAAKMAAELMTDLSKKGEKIGEMDTLTAGIALRHNQKLITRNKRYFSKISGLKLEGW